MFLIIEALKRVLFIWVTSMAFTVLEIKTEKLKHFLIHLKINLLHVHIYNSCILKSNFSKTENFC